jgi:hypothetical protein
MAIKVIVRDHPKIEPRALFYFKFGMTKMPLHLGGGQ